MVNKQHSYIILKPKLQDIKKRLELANISH